MRIGSDISSLGMINRLNQTNRALTRALERLSSGKRVNSPADDSVSFSFGVNLDAQSRGLRQAVRNINDSQSLLMVADSALESQADILQRMRELAVQASNGTLNSDQRDALQSELNSLLDEFSRITESTTFRDIHALEGIDLSEFIQLGPNAGDSIDLEIDSSTSESVFTKNEGTGRYRLDWEANLNYATSAGQATGDVDSDGDLDLVQVEGGIISTFANDGEGNFSFLSSSYGSAPATGNFTRGILTDLNGDNILDLVSSGGKSIYSFLGNGDGTFEEAKTLFISGATFNSNSSVRSGDINEDGFEDIVYAGDNDNVYVALSDGDGGFSLAATLGQIAGEIAGETTVGDLNGDGHLDIAARYSNDKLYLWYGDGSGAFNVRQTITLVAAGQGSGVEAGDIDNDGDLDLVAGNGAVFSTTVLLNNGTGNFSVSRTITESSFSSGMGVYHLTDINRDGYLDMMIGDRGASQLAIRFGDGSGNFALQSTIEFSAQVLDQSYGDFNGDGVTDALYSKAGQLSAALYSQVTEGTAVGDLDFSSQEKSKIALEVIDNAIANVTENRAKIGALHNRLEVTASVQLLASESIEEARSKSIDADIAEETAELVRNQILQQAQVAVLAQANLNMQTVLGLLRD